MRWSTGSDAPARIGRSTGADRCRRIQIANARCAYRAVEAAAQLPVLNGRVLEAQLEGVGREPGGVVRVAVAALETQVVDARHVVDDRHPRLDEVLVYVEHAVEGRGCTVAARREAVREDVVRIEVVALLAILSTDVDINAGG